MTSHLVISLSLPGVTAKCFYLHSRRFIGLPPLLVYKVECTGCYYAVS